MDDRDLGVRLARALARLDGYRRYRPDEGGLAAADMRLLWLIIDAGPQTLAEITQAVGLERSTVNRQVNAAVTAGLLDKTKMAGSRAHRVELTAAGRAAFEEQARAAVAAIDATLGELPGDDAARFVALAEEFAETYGRRTGCAPARS